MWSPVGEAAPYGLYAAGGSPLSRPYSAIGRVCRHAPSALEQFHVLGHSAQLVHTRIRLRFDAFGGRDGQPPAEVTDAAALLAIAVLGAAGCGGSLGSITRALIPSACRYDSLGLAAWPFDGTVVGAEHGQPIAGRAGGRDLGVRTEDTRPVGEDLFHLGGDVPGWFLCAAEPAAAQQTPLSLLRRFYAAQVYKAGFVGYRSRDYRADDLTLRHDFLPVGNKAISIG